MTMIGILFVGLLFHAGCIEAACREERWFNCKQNCPWPWTEIEHHNDMCCSSFWSCGGWKKKCRDDYSCADIDRIEYDLDNVFPSSSEAVFGKKMVIDNPHGVPRDGTEISFEQSVTEESWFEHTEGLEVSVGSSVTFGIPEVAEVGGSLEVTGSSSYTWGEKTTNTWNKKYETTLNVGAFESVECQAIITETEFSVPYTIYYRNGRTGSGVFHSIAVGGVNVRYTRHPIYSDNCNVALHRTYSQCSTTQPVSVHGTSAVRTAAKCAGYVWAECTRRKYFQWRASDNSCLCVEDAQCGLSAGDYEVHKLECTSGLDYCEDFEDKYEYHTTCYDKLTAGVCDEWYLFCPSTCCLNDFVFGEEETVLPDLPDVKFPDGTKFWDYTGILTYESGVGTWTSRNSYVPVRDCAGPPTHGSYEGNCSLKFTEAWGRMFTQNLDTTAYPYFCTAYNIPPAATSINMLVNVAGLGWKSIQWTWKHFNSVSVHYSKIGEFGVRADGNWNYGCMNLRTITGGRTIHELIFHWPTDYDYPHPPAGDQRTQFWLDSTSLSDEMPSIDHRGVFITSDKCSLAYCNAFPDLQNAFCGGKTCTTETNAQDCLLHFNIYGKNEHTRVGNTPRDCVDTVKNAATMQMMYLGCFNGNSAHRPYGDVSNDLQGVEDCRRMCHEGGFQYFGFECPRATIHCECASVVDGEKLSDQSCRQFNVNSGGHCIGPFVAQGTGVDYSLGAGSWGSLYSTDVVGQGVGGLDNDECDRGDVWCTHYGSTHRYDRDCDGDGVVDHECSDIWGSYGIISTSQSCVSTWPHGHCTGR